MLMMLPRAVLMMIAPFLIWVMFFSLSMWCVEVLYGIWKEIISDLEISLSNVV